MELQTKLNLSVSKTKHTTLKEVQSIMHPSPEPQQSIRFDKNSLFQNYHLQHGAFHVILADVYIFCIKCKLVTSGYHMIEWYYVTMLTWMAPYDMYPSFCYVCNIIRWYKTCKTDNCYEYTDFKSVKQTLYICHKNILTNDF